MSKWIMFGKKLLKKCDIDFFTLDVNDKFITCAHHQGQNYMETFEEFTCSSAAEQRFSTLMKMVGITDDRTYG